MGSTWWCWTPRLLLGILLLAGCGWPAGREASSAAPPHLGTAVEPATNSLAPLRVMTFNLRYAAADDGDNGWELRRDQLVETIRAFTPDILGTQECLAAQAGFLRQALPEYGFVGIGRENGRLAGEMCAIFYRTDRFVKLAAGHFWLSEKPNVPGSKSWDSALPRMVSWVRLRDAGDSTLVFSLFNTHFDHVGTVARLRSAQALRDSIAAKTGFERAIVTGDFNTPADTAGTSPYHELTGDPGESGSRLVDAYRALHAAGSNEGTYHGFTGQSDGTRIDWILLTPDLVPMEAQIVRSQREGRYPSDHFPVTAVIGLRPSP